MLTFTADKRGFKLRHVINMAPTTCDRVSQMRRKAVRGKQRERGGEKRQLTVQHSPPSSEEAI